jgi:anti-sigma B factor antagonist
MDIDFSEVNHSLIIKPRFRRLDAAIAPAFRDQVAPRLEGRRLVVFALGTVEFMDSSGLGSLVSLLKLLPPGGVVRLAEVATTLQKVLRMTRLDSVFQSYPSIDLAAA